MRVLLVEDYPPLQKSIAKGLRGAGFAVDATGNGEDGLWYARSNDYDAIVLDLMLPGIDGLTILRTLRAERRDTHVLVLTAKDTVPDRVVGLNAGADDYLVKPFAFEELLARVQALARRRYRQKSPEITVGTLRIDTVSRRAWRGTSELQLTSREYALLEYLLQRQGHTVSRSEIWEHLYDFADRNTSNVVDVYVGYLRRKIDEPGRPSLIRTVRGRGYILEESA
jgi:DNA-binding response OmpR family regulator